MYRVVVRVSAQKVDVMKSSLRKKWFERRIPLIIIKVTANNFDAYANNFCEKLFTYEYGITDSDSTQLIFLDLQFFFD